MDQHTIELALQIASLIAGIAVMRYQLKEHAKTLAHIGATMDDAVKQLNKQDTSHQLLEQRVRELETENKDLRDAKHDHANRIQALEFRTDRRKR